ncbi:hypothetical protein HIM_12390 [Hirsutella minnesotensis 3608]|nr:hypothetical protein HIM_12390 [Hirsutella minnesotensis 3608]
MPYQFRPERYLDDGQETGTPHFAYGAGSRMCAGSHQTNRELYTAFIRLITAFEMRPGRSAADASVMDAIECKLTPTSLTLDPRPFKIGLRPRNEARLRHWIAEAEARTRGLVECGFDKTCRISQTVWKLRKAFGFCSFMAIKSLQGVYRTARHRQEGPRNPYK